MTLDPLHWTLYIELDLFATMALHWTCYLELNTLPYNLDPQLYGRIIYFDLYRYRTMGM